MKNEFNTNYEESKILDIRYLFFLILKRWWLIVSLMLAASLISGLISVFYITPMYVGTTKLFVYKKNTTDISLINSLNTGSQIVKDAELIVKSRSVISSAIEKAKVDIPWQVLEKRITAVSKPDTRVFTIQVEDTDSTNAAILANAISESFIEQIEKLFGNGSEDSNIEFVSIIDRAQVNDKPVSPNIANNIIIAAILGAMAAVGILILIEMFNDTIRTPEDISKYCDTEVIGMIPYVED